MRLFQQRSPHQLFFSADALHQDQILARLIAAPGSCFCWWSFRSCRWDHEGQMRERERKKRRNNQTLVISLRDTLLRLTTLLSRPTAACARLCIILALLLPSPPLGMLKWSSPTNGLSTGKSSIRPGPWYKPEAKLTCPIFLVFWNNPFFAEQRPCPESKVRFSPIASLLQVFSPLPFLRKLATNWLPRKFQY